jgi:hypothetical protein
MSLTRKLEKLIHQGITDPKQLMKLTGASKTWVYKILKRTEHKQKVDAIDTQPHPKDTPSTTIEKPKVEFGFHPITAPPELTEPTEITEVTPTGQPLEVTPTGLITPEQMTGLIRTLNHLPPNERYRIAKDTEPLLGEAWSNVINKRLQDVDDPNFDIYWAVVLTAVACSAPVSTYIRDKMAERKRKRKHPPSKEEKMRKEVGK